MHLHSSPCLAAATARHLLSCLSLRLLPGCEGTAITLSFSCVSRTARPSGLRRQSCPSLRNSRTTERSYRKHAPPAALPVNFLYYGELSCSVVKMRPAWTQARAADLSHKHPTGWPVGRRTRDGQAPLLILREQLQDVQLAQPARSSADQDLPGTRTWGAAGRERLRIGLGWPPSTALGCCHGPTRADEPSCSGSVGRAARGSTRSTRISGEQGHFCRDPVHASLCEGGQELCAPQIVCCGCFPGLSQTSASHQLQGPAPPPTGSSAF